MAKATPSKSLGDLKEKYSKVQDELKETREKLSKEEEEVTTLIPEERSKDSSQRFRRKENPTRERNEESQVCQRQGDFPILKLYLDFTIYFQLIAEYRETNKELQKKVVITVTSPGADASPTLEADDSKTDTSIIESTPLAKRKGGRGRGRGRATRYGGKEEWFMYLLVFCNQEQRQPRQLRGLQHGERARGGESPGGECQQEGQGHQGQQVCLG